METSNSPDISQWWWRRWRRHLPVADAFTVQGQAPSLTDTSEIPFSFSCDVSQQCARSQSHASSGWFQTGNGCDPGPGISMQVELRSNDTFSFKGGFEATINGAQIQCERTCDQIAYGMHNDEVVDSRVLAGGHVIALFAYGLPSPVETYAITSTESLVFCGISVDLDVVRNHFGQPPISHQDGNRLFNFKMIYFSPISIISTRGGSIFASVGVYSGVNADKIYMVSFVSRDKGASWSRGSAPDEHRAHLANENEAGISLSSVISVPSEVG